MKLAFYKGKGTLVDLLIQVFTNSKRQSYRDCTKTKIGIVQVLGMHLINFKEKRLSTNTNKIGTFREWLREERKSNEYGLEVQGELLDVSIKMQKNKLVQVEVQGKRTLSNLKSIETLKREYSEDNHKELERIWKDLADEKSKLIEKLVFDFEKDLNNIIIDMEKEISKLD